MQIWTFLKSYLYPVLTIKNIPIRLMLFFRNIKSSPNVPSLFMGLLMFVVCLVCIPVEAVADMHSADTSEGGKAAQLVDLEQLKRDGGRYVCRYEEHYYDGVGESVLIIEAVPQGYRAVWEGSSDTTEIYADDQMRTERMKVTDSDTELKVERRGDRLYVTGFDEGESIDEQLKLGTDRWFQLLPFSLMAVTTSDAEETAFSMFDPFNIKVRNLRVTKQAEEIVTVKGREYETVKMSIRLQGFMKLFWKSEVWNHADSGTYVKYEGLNVVPKWYNSQILLKTIEYQR